MKGIQFNPDSVTVKVGGTVKWTNNESVPHDVTKEDGPGADFSSGKGNMKRGRHLRADVQGGRKVNYVCTMHPNMKGTSVSSVEYRPKPRSISRAASPSPPRWGRRPSCTAPS